LSERRHKEESELISDPEHVNEVMQAPPGCEAPDCDQAAVRDFHDASGCHFRCADHVMSLAEFYVLERS
jgi:hypothetical protein